MEQQAKWGRKELARFQTSGRRHAKSVRFLYSDGTGMSGILTFGTGLDRHLIDLKRICFNRFFGFLSLAGPEAFSLRFCPIGALAETFNRAWSAGSSARTNPN